MQDIISAAAGAAAGAIGIWLYRYLPVKWVCDYNEQPEEKHSRAARSLPWWAFVLCAAVCGAVTWGAVRTYGSAWSIAPAALMVGLLAVCAVSDIQYEILPDELMAAAGVLGVVLLFTPGAYQIANPWWMAFISAAAGFLGLWLILFVASKLYKTDAMGFGDVKLCAVAGLLCGLGGLGVCLLAAVFSAAIVIGGMLLIKKAGKRSMVAFGPFIIFGVFFVLALWPEWHGWVEAYLRLFA